VVVAVVAIIMEVVVGQEVLEQALRYLLLLEMNIQLLLVVEDMEILQVMIKLLVVVVIHPYQVQV
tara:strand:+ start:708 stop:902 length:195 start_codon:yes stop_codon:yes gene_type:complete